MPVIFECGKWQESPPKGTITPRQKVGRIFDRKGDVWEVSYWQVPNKASAAQFYVSDDLAVTRQVFFPSREEAISWRDNPEHPTIQEIVMELKKCEWHEPSKGLIQLWLNFRRA